MKVIDNFLSEDDFQSIQHVLMGARIDWHYNSSVAFLEEKTNLCYFTHAFYDRNMPLSDFFTQGLLSPLLSKLQIEFFIRVKGNLYPSTEKIQYHSEHVDYPFKHKAALFSINTCDGETTIGKEKIKSVANRVILFDGNIPHYSSTCTDQPARININLNWLQPSEW